MRFKKPKPIARKKAPEHKKPNGGEIPEPKQNEVKVGHWYLCATCASCGFSIPILEIEKDAPVSGDLTFSFRDVPCPDCGEKRDYPLGTLQRLRAQPMGRPH